MLLEELKKLKEELEQGQVEEEAPVEEEIVEDVEPEEEKKEPEKEPEKPKEEEKKEELDNAGYARLRREAAAERRAKEQLQQELDALRAEKKEEVEEPQYQPLPPEVQRAVEDSTLNRAEKEFSILEQKVKQAHPEYSAVATEYAQALYQSIRIQNPRKTDVELQDMTKRTILLKAGEFARQGYENPVEEMYHEARELGYTGKSLQKAPEKEAEEEKIAPDYKKVAENRKRSAGMAATNGRSQAQLTQQSALETMTVEEYAKLSVAEKRRLMYGE
jgi:hypothetical protein|tara:strand:+ start:4549 stop:5373 length:825 start_codon:yes stop_codon:yes gene_type:complete